MPSPEVLYLKQLVEAGESAKALDVGQQLLLREELTAEDLAHINRLIGCARFNSGDAIGALPPALLAMKLAVDLQDWDLHGTLCLEVGQFYLKIRDTERARRTLSLYLMYRERYQGVARLEPRIWGNLGISWAMEGNHRQALVALREALKGFLNQDDWYNALFAWQHALASARVASPKEVSGLLRKMRHFAKQHRSQPDVVAVFLLELGHQALRSGRYWRAAALGLRARELTSDNPWYRFHVHMLLAEASKGLGYLRDSMGYALAARVIALHGHLYALEFRAVRFMQDLAESGGRELYAELDREYLARGIDIGEYVDTSLLPPRNRVPKPLAQPS